MDIKKTIKTLLKPETRLARWSIAISLSIVFVLGALGLLDPAKEFLDSESLTFKIGGFSLSLYKLIKIIIALIVIFWFASTASDLGAKKLRLLRQIKASNRTLLIKALQIIIYIIAFLATLDVIGIDLTALAVFGGAVGIGIGFGLQKITSNFISGLILLFEKSIEEDDMVELSDGTVGFVRHTGARYTLVETFENREIMIPNEDFITNRVTNWTFTNSKGRIDINIGVSYGSDLDKVYKLILEAAEENPNCSKDPKPECYLREFGDSSVNFLLYFWVDDIIKGKNRPRSEILFTIWRKFKEHNVEIPFPQRDLHIKNPEALK